MDSVPPMQLTLALDEPVRSVAPATPWLRGPVRKDSIPRDLNAWLKAEYLSGRTLTELGEATGKAPDTVRLRLVQLGVEIRSTGEARNGKRTRLFTSEEEAQMEARYTAGETLAEIAHAFAAAVCTVRGVLVRRDVRIRTPSESGRQHSIREGAFEEITPASAYWAGFLMADGCVTDRGVLCVVLGDKDKHHLEVLRTFLGADTVPITLATKKEVREICGQKVAPTVCWSLQICSQRLVESLERYGVVPRKTYACSVGECVADDPHFWRGLLDGDGWVSMTPRTLEVGAVGYERVLEQFVAFVQRCLPGYHSRSVHRVKKAWLWRTELTGMQAAKLCELLYDLPGPALGRKLERARAALERYRSRPHWSRPLTCGFCQPGVPCSYGVKRHQKRGEVPCWTCRQAATLYERERRKEPR